MHPPLIILSPQDMPMEAPFRQYYHFTNAFNPTAILKAGGIPLLPPYLDDAAAVQLLSNADGLMLTGGEDIAPFLYGETPIPQCGPCNPRRDASDLSLLRAARQLQKPVLCICRGCQLANAFLGGTLYQDLPAQKPDALPHSDYLHYDEASAHALTLLPGTPLQTLLGVDRIRVNSLHHQAIHNLAPTLCPMACAPDGIVEAWYDPGPSFFWGIQWHPEMLPDDPCSDAIFSAFLSACR